MNTLIWRKKTAGPMSWEDAVAYCENLGNGWRLPTIEELSSVIDYSKYNPASSVDFLPTCYWSSTTTVYSPNYAWGVYFLYGSVYYGFKFNRLYVRAVR